MLSLYSQLQLQEIKGQERLVNAICLLTLKKLTELADIISLQLSLHVNTKQLKNNNNSKIISPEFEMFTLPFRLNFYNSKMLQCGYLHKSSARDNPLSAQRQKKISLFSSPGEITTLSSKKA